jgi:hypothetical protein
MRNMRDMRDMRDMRNMLREHKVYANLSNKPIELDL